MRLTMNAFLPASAFAFSLNQKPISRYEQRPDAFPADEQHRIVAAEHEQQHEEDEQVQIREVARVARVVLHVADAEDVDQRADARDDEHHHHRQLIELERGVDREIADRHPREVPLDERRVHLATAAHREEDRAVRRNESTSTAGPTMLVSPANRWRTTA